MPLYIALDTIAVRLWQLANDGRWTDAQKRFGDEALAMLRVFLYGDAEFYIPAAVDAELKAHGDPEFVSETAHVLEVVFKPLEAGEPDLLNAFVEKWAGVKTSAKDARWLGQVWQAGFLDAAVTFDLKLIRGVSGEIDGVRVVTPSQLLDEWALPPGSKPRVMPAPGHPLASIEGWRL